MTLRYYSTTAGEMVLQTGVTAGDTTVIVDTVAGLPVTFPYTLLLDYGTASEEVVDVTAASGTTLTVVRGRDGTVAQSHSFGAKIRHGVTARDFRESREHEAGTGAHGVATVVGTTEAQTLDNKAFEADGNHAALVVRDHAGNTEPTVDVRSSSNTRAATLGGSGLSTYDGGSVLFSALTGATASVSKKVAGVRLASDIHGIVGETVAFATGKFLRLMNGASEVFSVGPAGDLHARAGTFDSNVGVTGNVTATGTVGGTNITTLTSTSATNTTNIATVTGRVSTLEAAVPYKIRSGSVSVGAVTAGSNTSGSVTFPVGSFTAPPTVIVSAENGRLTASAFTITSAGFTWSVNNWTPAGSSASTLDWVATGV